MYITDSGVYLDTVLRQSCAKMYQSHPSLFRLGVGTLEFIPRMLLVCYLCVLSVISTKHACTVHVYMYNVCVCELHCACETPPTETTV